MYDQFIEKQLEIMEKMKINLEAFNDSSLSAYDVETYSKWLIKELYKMDRKTLNKIDDNLFYLNYHLNNYKEKNKKIFDKHYPIVCMYFISKIFHSLYKERSNESEFSLFYKNEINKNIIKILLRNDAISHNDLAKRLGKSPQALSNYFCENKNNNIYLITRSISNVKNKFYSLSFDAKLFYSVLDKENIEQNKKKTLETKYDIVYEVKSEKRTIWRKCYNG